MHALLLSALLFLQQPANVTPGSVSGRLLEANRAPVVRALMSLTPAPLDQAPIVDSYRVLTDNEGRFVFNAVPPGRYFLSYTNSETRRGVVVEPNGVVEGIELVLPPTTTFRISGRVIPPAETDLSKVPEGARRVTGYGGRPFRSVQAVLAGDGTFEIPRLTPGRYTLEVGLFRVLEPVVVTVSDRDVVDLKIQVPRTFAVTGRVAVDGRATRTGLGMMFIGPMPNYKARATRRPDGTLDAALVEGEYRVSVTELPAGYYLKSLTAGPIDLLKQPLKIDPALPAPPVVATLAASPGIKVSGHLKGNVEGLPQLESREITFAGTATPMMVSVPVGSDGSFVVEKLLPGMYSARVALTSSTSSAPVIVSIPDKEVKDLDVTLPGLKEIFGRVAVDGNGPAPNFSLLLVRGGVPLKTAAENNENKLPAVKTSMLEGFAERGLIQAIRVEIEPLADGSFKMTLPEGDYRVVTGEENSFAADIPEPFFLRSINYGSARLMTEPMVVSPSENNELHIGFGVSIPSPWARVSGRVLGLSSSSGPVRVQLTESVLAPIEAVVNPDGTFEFPMVLVNQSYVASLPQNEAATAVRLRSVQQDVKNVEIVIPPQREITVRASVEGSGAVPGFLLKLEGGCAPSCEFNMSTVVRPGPDGTARVKVPEDERRVSIEGLPVGYDVKSLTYGTTDLKDFRRARLKVGGGETRDLEVKFEVDPKVPTSSIRGRVTGLDPDRRAQLVLHGVSFVSSFETPLNSDGSFSFAKLPQGTYAASLTGDGVSGRMTPSAIVVTDRDQIGIELAAPRRNARADRPAAEPPPTGTSIQELGRVTGEDASFNAAVANLRTINTAQVTYLSASGGNYGTLKDMVEAGLLDSSFLNVKSGYSFSVLSRQGEYMAVAVPITSGRYAVYSTPDAIIRYSLAPILSIKGQEGMAVQ